MPTVRKSPVAEQATKVKCRPDDFIVEELTDLEPKSGGTFALYRLTKKSLGTPEAIDSICQRWNLRRPAISYGGLKDRHAITRQFVTISRGPRRDLSQTNLELEYLGQSTAPFTPKEISGNRFEIVLRNIAPDQLPQIEEVARQIARVGFPNYFDDQRFGSLGQSGEFVASPWCRENYDRALWLAIADANEHDRPRDKEFKAALRKHWGGWDKIRAPVPNARIAKVMAHLDANPDDFRTAFTLVSAEMRSLMLSAFQSAIWNAALTDLLQSATPAKNRREQKSVAGERCLVHPEKSGDVVAQLPGELPLPSARMEADSDDVIQLFDKVAPKFGITVAEMRIRFPKENFFSKGQRATWIIPTETRVESLTDDIYPQQMALRLGFSLPRGCYATMFLKTIQSFSNYTLEIP